MSPPFTFKVSSKVSWSHTGFMLEANATYEIAVTPPDQKWHDAGLVYDADGGMSARQWFFKWWLRVKSDGGRRAEFFTLIGTIGESLDHAFVIGKRPATYKPPISGELVCFANDCAVAYWNNSGSLDVTITRQGNL